jgi:hypothetical protein
MHGGDLPGGIPGVQFVQVAEPYSVSIRQLGDLLDLAYRHGCRASRLDGGRALVTYSLMRSAERWQDDVIEGGRVFASTRLRALRRAGILNDSHHIAGNSGDLASRSPSLAPWSIYPFSPEICADLICDLLIFETTISAQRLQAALSKQGMQVSDCPPVEGWRPRSRSGHHVRRSRRSTIDDALLHAKCAVV